MIEDLYNKLQSDKSDVVSCGVKWMYDSGEIIREDRLNRDECLNTETAMKELLVDGKLKQHVWNKLYKTELIKNIPFEKGKYHEDVFWSYQVIGKSKKVSVLSKSYYNYIQRENSIMGETYSINRLDALDACEKRCIYLKKICLSYTIYLFIFIWAVVCTIYSRQ